MQYSLFQYKRQTLASWSLLFVSLVLIVCFSQNLGLSTSCSKAPRLDLNDQTLTSIQDEVTEECSSSEQLINPHAFHLDFDIPLFILALVIIVATLKKTAKSYFFTPPITSYGVRRHLVFCTFQE